MVAPTNSPKEPAEFKPYVPASESPPEFTAKAIVLGGALTPLAGIDLALEGLLYEQSGTVVATNTAYEGMGNPLNSLAWIANHLGSRGLGLRAGDIVMTGSVSKILTARAGDTVRATFTRLGSVSVRFA